jgi:hypothetical protein
VSRSACESYDTENPYCRPWFAHEVTGTEKLWCPLSGSVLEPVGTLQWHRHFSSASSEECAAVGFVVVNCVKTLKHWSPPSPDYARRRAVGRRTVR